MELGGLHNNADKICMYRSLSLFSHNDCFSGSLVNQVAIYPDNKPLLFSYLFLNSNSNRHEKEGRDSLNRQKKRTRQTYFYVVSHGLPCP